MKSKGQTLVAIVVLSVLALTVGILVSNRFIKGLRSITESNNSSKALAIAEAAVERMLLIPNETLEDYINFGSCGDVCVLELVGGLGQRIRADVTLSFAGNSSEAFETKISENEVVQVNLTGYETNSNIDVCWDNFASIYANYIYEESSKLKIFPYAYNPVTYAGFDNGFDNASSNHGYTNCFSIITSNTPEMVRLKAFYSDSYIYVIPNETQAIPSQGIIITSTGRAGNAIKSVSVLKSSAMAPEYFDYVIYQKSEDDPLSNRPY